MIKTHDITELARIAFEAYAKSKSGVTYDERPIPPWNELGQAVQNAWAASARAIMDAVGMKIDEVNI